MDEQWQTGELSYPKELHSVHEDDVRPLGFIDLPMYEMLERGVVKCIIDVVMDVQGDVPTREIKSSLQSKDLKEVPAPYCIVQHPQCPVKLDIAVLKQLNGNHTAIKIINLGEKVKVGRARELCYGKAHTVDWKGDVKSMKKCLQFIFERLGVFQCRQHTFRSIEEGKPEKRRSEEEWEVGFDLIEEQGPREIVGG